MLLLSQRPHKNYTQAWLSHAFISVCRSTSQGNLDLLSTHFITLLGLMATSVTASRAGHGNCPQNLRLLTCTDMTIHWNALVDALSHGTRTISFAIQPFSGSGKIFWIFLKKPQSLKRWRFPVWSKIVQASAVWFQLQKLTSAYFTTWIVALFAQTVLI
jgi:hypothetical protein